MKRILKYLFVSLLIILVYYFNPFNLFNQDNSLIFLFVVICFATIEFFIKKASTGNELYMRPIAGMQAMEEAVGRSTEMGTPVLFIPGITGLDEIDTISGLIILSHVSKMTAEYESSLHVPVCVPIVMEAAKETCKESYLKVGRSDLYNENMVHYVTEDQFAYAAGVNGIMVREKPAAIFYQGRFYAESLILAETGNSIGAIQIAGTGSISQIPFFVTACDYTLIGEEFYAASAYLSKDPKMLGSIKGQDYIKIICMLAMYVVLISPLLMASYISFIATILLSIFMFVLIFNEGAK